MRSQFFTDLPSRFGRNSRPQFSSSNDCPRKHDSTRRDHCVSTYNGVVHDHRTHAHQRSFVHMRPVDDGIVSNAHVVFQDRLALPVGAMNHCTILNVDALSHSDGRNISADHR